MTDWLVLDVASEAGQETAQALVSQNELVHEAVNRNPARLCYLWTPEPNLGFSEEDVRLGFQAVSLAGF